MSCERKQEKTLCITKGYKSEERRKELAPDFAKHYGWRRPASKIENSTSSSSLTLTVPPATETG